MSAENLDPSPDSLSLAPSGEATETDPIAPVVETSEAVTTEETAEEKEHKKGGFQRRIEKLNQRVAERDALIDRLLKAHAPAEAEKPAAEAVTGKPRLEDYDNQADYLEALADHKVEERLKADREAKAAEETKRQAEAAQESFVQRINTAKEAHPDLDDLLDNDLPYTPAMAQVITRSDAGGELIYHLAKNPEECRRIARLAPLDAALEMGQIAATLKAASKPAEKPKTTSAPAPLQPVKGGGTPVTDPSKLSDADWMKSRRAS